ncbi:MAG: cell wall-active antibiotics response protein LiaF [Lysinibacillus sp.]
MKNKLLLLIGLLFFIELFIFHNGGVFFLLIAFALYVLSVQKEEKMYASIALVFALLAILSMTTLRWLIPAGIIYWLYQHYKRDSYTPVFFGTYETEEKPYPWKNQAVTRLFGDVTIDATKTILPLEPAFISIFQGIGKTTILVPYDVECYIAVNQGYGKVLINGEPIKSTGSIVVEEGGRRKLMIHVSIGMGEVEIWQK